MGTKALAVFVAGQNVTKNRDASGVRGVCSSGYYGQQAWTVFTGSDSECKLPCDKAQTNANNPLGRSCTARYEASQNDYVLESDFDDESPACRVRQAAARFCRFKSAHVAPPPSFFLRFRLGGSIELRAYRVS